MSNNNPTTAKPAVTAADYSPSPAELAVLKDFGRIHAAKSHPPNIKAEQCEHGSTRLAIDHPSPLVGKVAATRSVGSYSIPAANWLIAKLAEAVASSGGGLDEDEMNRALAMLHELKPRDEIESMLIAQMIATHSLIAARTHGMRNADNLLSLEANASALTKFQRTFTAQVEALQKYRGKAPQEVRVEHVHVHKGGQAIVGAIHQGGGVPTKSEDQPHAPALTHEQGQTLPSEIEAVGKAVPVARR